MPSMKPLVESKAYTTWKLSFPLLDAQNQLIEIIEGIQELYVGPKEFIVRVTRQMNGLTYKYEDRGSVDSGGGVVGRTGFGGELKGQLLKDNFGVLLEGHGGDADFILGAVVVSADHNRCFRQFKVHTPTTLFGVKVEPGKYFTTSDDYFISSSDVQPQALREPMAKAGFV